MNHSSMPEMNEKIQFRNIMSQSRIAIAILESEAFIVRMANKQNLAIWDKTLAEVLDKPLFEIFPGLGSHEYKRLLTDVYTSGKPYTAKEIPARLFRNGAFEMTYLDVSYEAYRNDAGDIEGIIIVSTEVTEAVLAARQMSGIVELNLFEKVVMNANDAIVITDAETVEAPGPRILFVNNAFCQMTGYTEQEVIGQSPRILQGAKTDPKELAKIKAALTDWKEVRAELVNYTKTGDEFYVELMIFPVVNNAGWLTHWVAIQRDVTEKNAELERLKYEDERKAGFMKILSHELKTPISSIRGYVQLMQSIVAKEEEQPSTHAFMVRSLQRIDNQVERLTKMIADMLDLTRIEESKLRLTEERLCLNDVVIETVNDLQYTTRTHLINIKSEEVYFIHADKNRIQQVLVNLVNNAIKYSPGKSGVDITISSKEKEWVSVSIRDYGFGISKNEHSKIFDRFYRVDDKEQNPIAGFGIGLFICREIIERHNGSIILESEPGKGSEFTFLIPRTP